MIRLLKLENLLICFLESHLEMILSVFTIKTEDLFVTMMQQEKYE